MDDKPFIERLLGKVQAHAGGVVVVAERKLGTPYLFQELVKREPTCLWLQLSAEDANQPVTVGDKLADALTRALGVSLFGYGLPYGYGLGLLAANLPLFEPLTVIVSGAAHQQTFATEVMSLRRGGVTVILEFEDLPDQFLIPASALVLQADDLRLTPGEARALVADRLGEVETQNLHRLTGGAFETFLLELHRRLSLPPRMRPQPGGGAPPPGADVTVPPTVLLDVLVRRKQWREALEVAAEHEPGRVGELLKEAGDAYLEHGLYQRLWDLLSALPARTRSDEAVLFWHLRAAKRLGRVEELREPVEAHLRAHEAPDLRAFYAGTLPSSHGFAEAERAYRAAKTFTTLQHYGNFLSGRDTERSLAVFRDLVELTDRRGNPAKRACAAMLLAFPLLLSGRYVEAAQWLEQALATFDGAGLKDWQARLYILHTWAYARVLVGETIGLRDLLEREVGALRDAYPALAAGFRSTLADCLLAQGRVQAALEHYLTNLDLSKSAATRGVDFPPYLLRDAVNALLQAGAAEEAAALVKRHGQLALDTGEPGLYARLARGMVLTLQRPEAAVGVLEPVCAAFEGSNNQVDLVSPCLYLARAQLSNGHPERARAALARAHAGLAELSDGGFRLLAGPEEAFRAVKVLWRGRAAPLRLTYLGAAEVILEDGALHLFPLWHEVLTLLAAHPRGLSPEQLSLLLYGEDGHPDTLKATLSKLRRHVPISRAPYRLDVAYEADFLQLAAQLREGQLRGALELYNGPLLPKSDAPGVVAAREELEETLRQAVLASDDPEALLNLSHHFGDDVELWEASLEALSEQDPRRPLVVARHKRVLAGW